MAAQPNQDQSPAYYDTVEAIMTIYRSLPARPSIEEVEAALSVVKTVSTEEQLRLEEITMQASPQDVPPELFSLLQQVKRTLVLFQSYEQRKEAMHLVQLDKFYETFDELIQRASLLVSESTHEEKVANFGEIEILGVISEESVIKNRVIEQSKGNDLKALVVERSASFTTKSTAFSSGEEAGREKLSLMEVAALIENIAKSGAEVLNLEGKLMEKVEWLPLSLGKLSNITELNLSWNRIMALPTTIGSLESLTKLDIHSNQLINLPHCIGQLVSLTDLDLHANRLKSLPASFGMLKNLINLDLSSNNFSSLPDVIGSLTALEMLKAESNELDKLPCTIGSCSSLVQLRLDFNQLKALPEAVGKLECLEILNLHSNRIKGLPTTMGNLQRLRELDISFNEVENIPENLCFARRLEKLNVGYNFADLRALPKSIGNLESLEELDISDDQIRILPDSFRFLSNLKVFHADETPLEEPPRQIVKLGAQAVVEYMTDLVATRDLKFQRPNKRKGFCSWIRQLFWR